MRNICRYFRLGIGQELESDAIVDVALQRHNHADDLVAGILVFDVKAVAIAVHRIVEIAIAHIAGGFFIRVFGKTTHTGQVRFFSVNAFAVFVNQFDVDRVITAGLVNVFEFDTDGVPEFLSFSNLGRDNLDLFQMRKHLRSIAEPRINVARR